MLLKPEDCAMLLVDFQAGLGFAVALGFAAAISALCNAALYRSLRTPDAL
jgi:hypothetical protein